jgi:hypothetical protein
MATNNVLNAPFPLSATQGGLGVASPTAHGILIGEGSSAVNPIVLTAGQVLIGTTASDPVGATLTAGSGISITSVTGSITIAATGGFTYNSAASGTQAMVANNGYYVNNGASVVAFTLPSTCAAGARLAIVGYATGGWTLAQNSGQSIQFGNVTTTVGAGGSLASSNYGDCVELLCVVADTTFVAYDAVGNLTYV